MNNLLKLMTLFALACFITTTSIGQDFELPKPGPEYDVLKPDVGTWDVEIKTSAGPGEPTVSKGKETNRMLGGFWLLSNFRGNMMGLDFRGHGIFGYDAEQKQYVGTWIDSLSPGKMDLIGKYDKANKTMTYQGMGPGPDGQSTKHILTTKYSDDGTRVTSMHMQAGEELTKIFEMSYTKAKAAK